MRFLRLQDGAVAQRGRAPRAVAQPAARSRAGAPAVYCAARFARRYCARASAIAELHLCSERHPLGTCRGALAGLLSHADTCQPAGSALPCARCPPTPVNEADDARARGPPDCAPCRRGAPLRSTRPAARTAVLRVFFLPKVCPVAAVRMERAARGRPASVFRLSALIICCTRVAKGCLFAAIRQ